MGDDSRDDGVGLKRRSTPRIESGQSQERPAAKIDQGDSSQVVDQAFDPDRLVFADDIEPESNEVDQLEFAPEAASRSESSTVAESGQAWQVLVVDDDPDVLTVTRMGFRNLELMDRPVHLICAHSAKEARDILSTHTRIAVLLTDVVMETDSAGLELVHWLRAQPKGHLTRVVVRTGQPGLAPEEVVLRRYDINDYWPKTALEMGRMRSQLIGLIRSFNDIEMLQSQTEQLGQLVDQRLPKYESLFKTAAEKYQLDWHLIAAIAYQESHWNPRAKSPTGVRGLMMLTLDTAKEMKVTNRLDPIQSLEGGVAYFLKLKSRLPERISDPDRTLFALAAYNVGFGHLEDARILTARNNHNPDSWTDVRIHLPLLSKKKYYSTVKRGYARGNEPVIYVDNIQYYRSYLKLNTVSKRPTMDIEETNKLEYWQPVTPDSL